MLHNTIKSTESQISLQNKVDCISDETNNKCYYFMLCRLHVLNNKLEKIFATKIKWKILIIFKENENKFILYTLIYINWLILGN